MLSDALVFHKKEIAANSAKFMPTAALQGMSFQ